MKMRILFSRNELNLGLRLRLLKCYVYSTLLYGCESWTMDPALDKRTEAFEMYLYRRILKISWTQKIANVEVLNGMKTAPELLDIVKRRKLAYLGHIMRGERYEILRFIIEGKLKGKRSIGRRQNSWMKDLRRWFGCTTAQLFRSAVSRISIAMWITNLRSGEGV